MNRVSQTIVLRGRQKRNSTTLDLWDQFRTRGIPHDLVAKLHDSYIDLKDNFQLGKHRPGELEAGHFSEVVVRVLQWATGGIPDGRPFTPLSEALPRFDQEVLRLAQLNSRYAKSLRVHIPRVLLAIQDIRNSRGVGHPSGDVNPNLVDATLVTVAADWVLAELTRLYYSVSLEEAQAIVDGLAIRRTPMIQIFDAFPKILRTDLTKSEEGLALLYHQPRMTATGSDLAGWLRVPPKEARRILRRHDDRAYVHYDEKRDVVYLAAPGVAMVEQLIAAG